MHYLFALRNAREGWTLDGRKTYFRALAQASDYLGGAGMPDFVRKIREESTATLSAGDREELGALLDNSLEETSIDEPPSRPFVRKWTVDALADSLHEIDRPRDLQRGEAVFVAASCIKCHRIAGRGTLVGPDLTAASSRFSRRDLLESIIKPSKVVPEKYRSLLIVTTDGKTHVGQTVLGGDYRSPLLRMATDPAQPYKITEIPKSVIGQQRPSPVSWMPEGLLDTFDKEAIFDLVAYIEARGETSE